VARCIAHLDVDAFFASVELLRRPELRGLPVIVAGSGPRAVVTTASYEARRFGVGSAMPASRARRLCPDAVVIPPDFRAYRDVSREVMDLVRAEFEHVQVAGLDEAYLDLTGLVAPRAAMRRLAARIREATGLSVSVGIGPSKLVAKVASDAEKPAGFVVLTREEARARFAGASPGLVPGIGPKTVARLQALGIATLGSLATAPDELLARHFGGRQGPWLRHLARFEDAGDVATTARAAVSESRETTFDADIADGGRLEEILGGLAAELCSGLERHGRRGRTVAIKVRLDDFTTVTRARTIARATNDAAEVTAIAVALLRDYAPGRPVRLLGVRVASFEDEAVEREDAAAAAQLALPM
jgi:DNA polymerase-4